MATYQECPGDIVFDTALSREALERYGAAALAIAGADGELGKGERDTLLRDGYRRGAPATVLESWANIDWQLVDRERTLRQLRTELSVPMARLLIYDAIRAARADGAFALQERKAVEDAGELLGLEPHVVRSLQGLVETEEALDRLRRGLILLD